MFRRPRESSDVATVIGRPPTPPGTPAKTPFTLAKPPSVPAPKMAITRTKPVAHRQTTLRASTTPAKAKAVAEAKGNSSILSFFKKSDGPDGSASGLFVAEVPSAALAARSSEVGKPQANALDEGRTNEDRYNEAGGSVKRRRMSDEHDDASAVAVESPSLHASRLQRAQVARRSGPFLDESDSEQEEEEAQDKAGNGKGLNAAELTPELPLAASNGTANDARCDTEDRAAVAPEPPPLVREETSLPDLDGFKDFEGMDDFDEDLFEEGDEFQERRYMEEQACLEAAELRDNEGRTAVFGASGVELVLQDDSRPPCPICGADLTKTSDHEAGVHVNNCLDGNPTPLPEKGAPEKAAAQQEKVASANQYRKVIRPPKPGQANPFTLGESSISGGSAFNKLMSGHAEDAAWAEAAAAEHASRGKPAYQRTCPFYKILPGLFICVDAFRYGAVAGCKAYFLSHFHSDHYIGLTSSWSHGPIYCSKVTANLVRQQLRVDPQYVVPLEFEETVEVPGTQGVRVSMISANHCPGSSLFLFEKTVGKRPNGEPRLQRILHCGDFRACKMHVEHPLLRPDVRDKITGKTREQKIDVCYLDTTYLNPKYAFPSQQAVIKACADMCVCLSKDTPDDTDGWETMKRQRAGEGMAKFVRKESQPEIKREPEDEKPNDVKVERNPHASQQILSSTAQKKSRGRLLVVVGTYSIGKERICLGIARALNSKIYAPPSKQRIVAALEDPELDARMTNDPREAQVHMTPLFEIRAETLDDYLRDFFPHFTRAVGFRPSGWNYRPPNTRFIESPSVQTVLHGENWKSNYSMRELVPQRGSSSRASCFGVPYSEHSSFRELTMFCCALRIDKIIPTVNVGSHKGRERMKAWCDRWSQERKKNGLYTGWE